MCVLMTRRRAPIGFTASILLWIPAALLVAQQPFIGPRAAGMAGAQTAVANDSTALWANPAGLGLDPKLDVDLFGAALATDRGHMVQSFDVLRVLNPVQLAGNAVARAAALSALQSLSGPGVSAIASGVAGLGLSEMGLGIGVGDIAYAAVYPNVDLVHVLPSTDPVAGFQLNTSGLTSVGLEARELRVGYAYALYGRTLLVGATTRYIFGRTYYGHATIFGVGQDNLGSLIAEARKQNEKSSGAFTFDVGAMLNVASTVRVGIVSTAMTNPKFDVKQSATNPLLSGAPTFIRIPRTVRAGASVTPISALTVALDYDLVPSDTLLPGGKSQQFSAGAEVKLPILAIRAGLWRDFKAPDPHWSYAAGFGLHLAMVSVNAALLVSKEGGLNWKSASRRDLGVAVDGHFRF